MPTNRWLDLFTSLRLTIFLLLALSAAAVFGTLRPLQENRFELYYQTPLFRLLLLLLALNIAACTYKTWRRNRADRSRLGEILRHRSSTLTADTDPLPRLQQAGFALQELNGGTLAWRNRAGRWGSTLVHLSLLMILLGGTLAGLGFVGTAQLAVGDSINNYFDWDWEQERPLDFTLRLDDFKLLYYPIDVRFGVYDPTTRQQLAEIISREGEIVDLPLPGLSAQVVQFVPFDQTLHLQILQNGRPVGFYHTPPPDKRAEQAGNPFDTQFLIRPTGFRDPIIRQYQSRVSILEQGEVVEEALIEINRPLVHRGVAIYQTSYQQDDFGFYYSGLQLSKDPGEPLVWGGSILLILGMYAAFFLRYRAIGIVRDDENGWQLLPLHGFNDARGRELLESLAAQTNHEAEPLL